MSDLTPNQWTILEALQEGPGWMRSFQTVKPLLRDLIGRGLVEPCRPHLGRARNMVRLTSAGCELLEIDPADLPQERARPALQLKPKAQYLPIKEDAAPEIRSTCQAFLRSVEVGATPGQAVAELAAAHDVQRPAIWRRLRSGGIIAPYNPRQQSGKGRPVGGGVPGYTERRRERTVALAEERHSAFSPVQIVDRDPCPRCGVRGDVGCGHSRAMLGTVM